MSVSVHRDIDLRIRDAELRTVRLGSNGETPCRRRQCRAVFHMISSTATWATMCASIASGRWSNAIIDDGAVLQDVDALTADAGATCGAGTEVETVNEGGGRW
jgi:hypothetical protein